MDSVALKRLRTAWELVFGYVFLISSGLLLRVTDTPHLILSLLLIWALLFALGYLWGSYDLEIGPAFGIRLRTEAVFASSALVYLFLARFVLHGLVFFPYGFWIALFVYLNLISPLLTLMVGKLSQVPALCVSSGLSETDGRMFSYWGYRCAASADSGQLADWLRSRSDERNCPAGCEVVLLDLRNSRSEDSALALSRLYFVDFVGVRATGIGAYLLGRHCKYIHFMPMSSFDRRMKRVVDLLLSFFVLVLLSPFLLVVAIAIKLDSPGPILYKHRRLGRNMKYFSLLKFRTMFEDADRRLRKILAENPELRREFEATYKLKNDPRATRVGRFLRSTSLDEIPQLFNIIKDQMSWVGPRPIVAGEIPFYKKCDMLPFRVTPGATGLWQISGRNDASYERRVELDLQYVNNWSYWQDIKILVGTIPAVLSRRGAY
jgi:lipopolysaccharide/colanic/teichoic acid biosynthesis glycosyltransferase